MNLNKMIYDMYYLCDKLDCAKLNKCIETFIFNDVRMREKTMPDIIRRVQLSLTNLNYTRRIEISRARWIDEDISVIVTGIIDALEKCDVV